MKLPSVVLANIETAFNHLIADQPEIIDPSLNGKNVCLDLTGINIRLYFRFIASTVILMDSLDHDADAHIAGTPVALLSAGFTGRANSSDIQLSGDLQIARAFEKLLNDLDIDWEEMLSQYTGDAIAFQLGETVRGLQQWVRQSGNAFADDLRDYLQIETRQLPLPDEVDTFNRAVDDVRASVERFELRIKRLQDRLTASNDAAL